MQKEQRGLHSKQAPCKRIPRSVALASENSRLVQDGSFRICVGHVCTGDFQGAQMNAFDKFENVIKLPLGWVIVSLSEQGLALCACEMCLRGYCAGEKAETVPA